MNPVGDDLDDVIGSGEDTVLRVDGGTVEVMDYDGNALAFSPSANVTTSRGFTRNRYKRNVTSLIGQARKAIPIVVLLAAVLAPAMAFPAERTSHWTGTTEAGCGALVTNPGRCGAVQNITLTLVDENSKITGSYTCAFGTQNCRGMQNVGKIISGSLSGERVEFAVLTPDGSTCRYTGLLAHDSGRGAYNCKGGTRLGERGSWRIHRSAEGSAAPPPQIPPLLRP
jgi:hypothetical protein